MTTSLADARPQLGEFNSFVCFKAVIVGVEDTLGPDGAAVVFIRAGKVRGHNLVRELNLTGSRIPVADLAKTLNAALGKDGTRLCVISNSYEDGDKVVVETLETVCSAGEEAGSDRKCTFTLGAVWGALEAIMGETYLGEQTDSVLRGGTSDQFTFTKF